MKQYDVIVVGSGCGMIIAEEAVAHGLKVALVDKGPLGGTCLNLGCIPSKILIFVADRVVEMQQASKLGIEAQIRNVDFKSIMERMQAVVDEGRNRIKEGLEESDDLDYYEGEGHFVDSQTIEVKDEKIRGNRIFLASGSRPFVPEITGLHSVDYLTSETLLKLRERPDSLIIIGGGYVAVEYGHFFAALGTRVTILEMASRLVATEEPEISELLKEELSRRLEVHTGTLVREVGRHGDAGVRVVAQDKNLNKQTEYTAKKVLVAVGRRSNSDLSKAENAGIDLDDKGFIKTNEHLETSQKNIFAVGDANGQQMFTHVSNREAAIAINNVLHGARDRIDYSVAPHAVYSCPQIASVGLTEQEARKTRKILVGRARYLDVAKGEAMMEKEGFAKIVVDGENGKILGFHIIGPYAPELIQEVVNAMAYGGHIDEISKGIHIHPALSELIPRAVGGIGEP